MNFIQDKDWFELLKHQCDQEYFIKLNSFLEKRYQEVTCFPSINEIYTAFEKCPLSELKVVILGQDPYHGKGQAHGLAFSVNDRVQYPPSLQNIFKEIKRDLGIPIPNSGSLERWANQGVLLLNTVLSVEEGKADSHKNMGWELFTDAVITAISQKKDNVIFLLWGNKAIIKKKLINLDKHVILETSHPSPLSVYRGFEGCGHFSVTNRILREKGLAEIQW
ncbi:MAG: uracil-DNA glycosylase [Flavobacteriales bacterium]|jgi:uracil-DNA glycosylase